MTKAQAFLIRAATFTNQFAASTTGSWRYEDWPGKKPQGALLDQRQEAIRRTGRQQDRRNLASFDTALGMPTAWGSTALASPSCPSTISRCWTSTTASTTTVEFQRVCQRNNSGTYVEITSGRLARVYTGPLFQAKSATSGNREWRRKPEVYCGAAYTTFTGNKRSPAHPETEAAGRYR